MSQKRSTGKQLAIIAVVAAVALFGVIAIDNFNMPQQAYAWCAENSHDGVAVDASNNNCVIRNNR
jgi:hypothetical protein